jgi:hypothetical protein
LQASCKQCKVAYDAANSDRRRARQLKRRQANPQLWRFNAKKANCKSQNVPFELVFEEMYWPTHCPVLGIELDYGIGQRSNSMVFFRLDHDIWYVPGNVIVTSNRANNILYNASVKELRQVLEFIEAYEKKRETQV